MRPMYYHAVNPCLRATEISQKYLANTTPNLD